MAPGKWVVPWLSIMNHPEQASSLKLSFPISLMLGLGLAVFEDPRVVLPTSVTLVLF